MKEIKFKAWDKDKKAVCLIHGISFDIKTYAPSSIKVKGQSWENADKFELLQWTGFTDSSGNDVYESDTVKISNSLYKVAWNESEACFELIESGSFIKLNISDAAFGTVLYDGIQNSV